MSMNLCLKLDCKLIVIEVEIAYVRFIVHSLHLCGLKKFPGEGFSEK
jgi:hypothetical protein